MPGYPLFDPNPPPGNPQADPYGQNPYGTPPQYAGKGIDPGVARWRVAEMRASGNAAAADAEEQRMEAQRIAGLQADTRGYQERARSDQMAQEQRLLDAMNGVGPSVAEQQMRQGQDASMAQALSMAASGRGGNVAAAQRQAQMAQAQLSQGYAAEAAELRAKEQLQARAELTQAIANRRSMELQAMGLDAHEADRFAQAMIAQMTGQNQGAQREWEADQAWYDKAFKAGGAAFDWASSGSDDE